MENENTVVETTENVGGQPTEQNVEKRLYSEAEIDAMVNKRVDSILPKKINRERNKLEKKYADTEAEYKRLVNVLKAGTQKETVDEITDEFTRFYQDQGIAIPKYNQVRNEREEKILAEAEAQEIIDAGYDEIVYESNRLSQIPFSQMSARDKVIFQKIGQERKRIDSIQELSEIGVTSDILNDKEYLDFTSKLNQNLKEKEKYEMYMSLKPKEKVQPLESQKGSSNDSNGLKEFYTPEEARKFTVADFDKNPELYKRVTDSMQKWK